MNVYSLPLPIHSFWIVFKCLGCPLKHHFIAMRWGDNAIIVFDTKSPVPEIGNNSTRMPLRLIIEEFCQNFIAWSKVPTKSSHLIRMYYINAISIVSHHLNFIVTSGSWPSHYMLVVSLGDSLSQDEWTDRTDCKLLCPSRDQLPAIGTRIRTWSQVGASVSRQWRKSKYRSRARTSGTVQKSKDNSLPLS